MHKLPAEMDTQGIRQMEPKDVPKVTIALNKHLYDNYKVHITFSEEDYENTNFEYVPDVLKEALQSTATV